MTKKQFQKKIDIARKYGMAKLEDDLLIFHGNDWAVCDKDNNTVVTAYDPMRLFYLFE